jgi:RHS repeat-associated protein
LKEQSYASSDDTFGNVTSRNYNGTTATLSYDGLDQLVTWNAGSSSQEQYVYDAYGGRVLRRSTMAGITTMTVYAFGLEEHLYSGTGVNQGNTYYYSLAGHLIGELTNAGTNMVLTDALGSVITTISATAGSASVQGNQAYGPYGNTRYQAGSMGTAKGFTGQYQDATGLDYYNARDYDPVVGRFLSADTVQGNGAGLDPYAYVGGNPETTTDPTGQSATTDQFCAAASSTTGCNDPNDVENLALAGGLPTVSGGSITGSDASALAAAALLGLALACTSGGACSQNLSWLNSLPPPSAPSAAVNSLIWSQVRTPPTQPSPPPLNSVRWSQFRAHQQHHKLQQSQDETTPRENTSTSSTPAPATGGTGGNPPRSTPPAAPSGEACSFTFSTPVKTDHGEQAIGTMRVGERVLAYHPQTGKREYEPILHVWINHDNDLVDLTMTTTSKGKPGTKTSEVIHTTQKHPFLTIEDGFVPVRDLRLGMHLLRADGNVGVITGWKVVSGSSVMYNLEVARDHIFVVGVDQWVVHNHCGPGGDGQGFENQARLNNHFIKHNLEFHPPFANASEYENAAVDFMTQPQTSTLHEGLSLRFDGTIDTIRVDDSSGWYGVMGENGIIRSFYIPGRLTPVEWFLSQIEDLIF